MRWDLGLGGRAWPQIGARGSWFCRWQKNCTLDPTATTAMNYKSQVKEAVWRGLAPPPSSPAASLCGQSLQLAKPRCGLRSPSSSLWKQAERVNLGGEENWHSCTASSTPGGLKSRLPQPKPLSWATDSFSQPLLEYLLGHSIVTSNSAMLSIALITPLRLRALQPWPLLPRFPQLKEQQHHVRVNV